MARRLQQPAPRDKIGHADRAMGPLKLVINVLMNIIFDLEYIIVLRVTEVSQT